MSNASHVLRANLSPADRKRLVQRAAREGVPVPQVAGNAIRAYLNGGKKK